MKKLALLLLFVSVASQAAEEITGAFGFKFGEVFDMSRTDYAVGEIVPELGDMGDAIDIEEEVVAPFDKYTLYLNPKNHEIYSIKATVQEDEECFQHIDDYANAISEKYQLKIIKSSKEPIRTAVIVNENGTKGVVISCAGNHKNNDFHIQYVDMTLRAKVEKIVMDKSTDKIDASVL